MGKNKRFFSVWGQDFYQSMDSRRRKYIDKVIDFLLRDTIIDYEDNHIDFPFFPMYSLFINDENLRYFYHEERFNKYCMEQYGLTEDETEYVWTKYRYSIGMNIGTKGGTEKDRFGRLGESDDRRKNFLDKVVDFLVKDTKVDYEDREIFFPFTQKIATRRNTDNSTPFHKILFHKDSIIPIGGFMEYIEEMYGITYIKDVSYVWGKYKDIMRNTMFGDDPTNEPIYESEDNKQKYLNKIIDWLVSDTDVDSLWFEPPYKNGNLYAENSITLSSLYKQTFGLLKYVTDVESVKFAIQKNYFKKFCEEQYGLTEDETEYVWKGFMKDLYESEKYNSLNESEDKKQAYLDKIVDWLFKDTEVGNSWFNPPYYYPGSSAGRTGFKSVYEHTFGLSTNNTYSGLDSQLIYFDSYCKNNYGLTGEETKIVWYDYMKKLKESYDWGF
jgi:hypothetical protein